MLFTNEHCYLIRTKEIAEANFCQMGLESIEPHLKSTGESRSIVRRTEYVIRRVAWEYIAFLKEYIHSISQNGEIQLQKELVR